jgi:RNA polymerase sigma factor (TIGR02999 family)
VDEERTAHVTRLLELWGGGDGEALDELFPLIYDELRRLAAHLLRRERAGHTLDTTALVHEAYVRLTGRREASVKDRAHFVAVAAQAMRRILVDHARRHQADKRIAPADKVPLDHAPLLAVNPGVDVLALNHALSKLSEVNPRQTRVIELRYFAGLTNDEVAEVLEVSVATVERDWHAARLWLRRQLDRSPLDG